MPHSPSEIIVLFLTYSFIGWLWEICYCSIKDHHSAYRGFLFGPCCPVYGFAVMTALITTCPFRDNILLLFAVGFTVVSIFECVVSWLFEKLSHTKLRDYSYLKGNIQGRAAPQILPLWGIGVVLLVKFAQLFIQRIINWEESWTHEMLALTIVLMMGTNTILSTISVGKPHIITQQWDERATAYRKELLDRLEKAALKDKLAIKDHLQDWQRYFTQHLNKEGAGKQSSRNHRRLIKSFPKLKMTDSKYFNNHKNELKSKQDHCKFSLSHDEVVIIVSNS